MISICGYLTTMNQTYLKNQAWWLIPIIPALERPSKWDFLEFETTLPYLVNFRELELQDETMSINKRKIIASLLNVKAQTVQEIK